MAVVTALQARGLGFIHCIVGVVVLTELSLADAKILVDKSEAFADDRDDREAMWEAMHAEVMTLPGIQDRSTPRQGPGGGAAR